MPTLPKNPTVEQYQTYFDSLSPSEQQQFRKAGLLKLINTVYTDGAEDVMEDSEPESGAIASGVFKDDAQLFRFSLTNAGITYQPTKEAINVN